MLNPAQALSGETGCTPLSTGTIVKVGCMNAGEQDEPNRINQHMALAALGTFGAIVAPFLGRRRRCT